MGLEAPEAIQSSRARKRLFPAGFSQVCSAQERPAGAARAAIPGQPLPFQTPPACGL